MKVSDFDFPFDSAHIAQHPIEPRDAAKLLDLSGVEAVHRTIADLPGLIDAKDLVIVNNTKVIPARLYGLRGEVKVEATLVRQQAEDAWWALARPGKRLKEGQTLMFAEGLEAEVTTKAGAEADKAWRAPLGNLER